MSAPDHGLRARGRILLVSCYELGHTPSGLAMPLAFLERAGFAPATVDVSVEPLTDALIDRAALVAISVPMHTALRLGVAAARRVRARNPRARLCFFGLYAPLNAGYLQEIGADWILGGESEEELVARVRRLADSGDAGDGGGDADEPRVHLGKLDFPVPRRARLPVLGRYARLDTGAGTRLAGYTEATRGCLDTCRHCPVPSVYGGRFFVVPADVVLADIAQQVEAGAEHITFGDPDFLNGPRHGMSILRRMHERWPHLSFDITTQVSHLRKHRGYVAELAGLGCAFVVSAVESLSDEVLARLRKRHRRADVEDALALCGDAGVAVRPTFVPFTPWTRLEDLRELVDVIAGRGLISHVDPVQLTIRLLVPPGSLLLDAPDTRDAFGALDPAALTHVWTHDDPRVDALQRALARRVEQATRDEEDPTDTFMAVRAQIYAACGRAAPALAPEDLPRKRVPRVTEPWFC